jgi:hypothetical protein
LIEYIYFWKYCGRKGQKCKILKCGKTMGTVEIEFEDGFKMITLRKALRRLK